MFWITVNTTVKMESQLEFALENGILPKGEIFHQQH